MMTGGTNAPRYYHFFSVHECHHFFILIKVSRVHYLICVYISTFQNKYQEYKKFRWTIPTYIDHLVEMFHGNTVDGRSSCIPGGNSTPADTYGDEDDQDADGDADGT